MRDLDLKLLLDTRFDIPFLGDVEVSFDLQRTLLSRQPFQLPVLKEKPGSFVIEANSACAVLWRLSGRVTEKKRRMVDRSGGKDSRGKQGLRACL